MKLLIKSHKELRLVRKKNKTFYQHFVVADREADNDDVDVDFDIFKEAYAKENDYDVAALNERAKKMMKAFDALSRLDISTFASVFAEKIFPYYRNDFELLDKIFDQSDIQLKEHQYETIEHLYTIAGFFAHKDYLVNCKNQSHVSSLIAKSWKRSSRNIVSIYLQDKIKEKFNLEEAQQFFKHDSDKQLYMQFKRMADKDEQFAKNVTQVIRENYKETQNYFNSLQPFSMDSVALFNKMRKKLENQMAEIRHKMSEKETLLIRKTKEVEQKLFDQIESDLPKVINKKLKAMIDELYNGIHEGFGKKLLFVESILKNITTTDRINVLSEQDKKDYLILAKLLEDAKSNLQKETYFLELEIKDVKDEFEKVKSKYKNIPNIEAESNVDEILDALTGRVIYGKNLKELLKNSELKIDVSMVEDDKKYTVLYRGVTQQYNLSAPLESWTSNMEIAEGFDDHAVLQKIIPIENIYTFYKNKHWERVESGSSEYSHEEEHIVINGGKPMKSKKTIN